jgi:glycosyltransferase involved in cell wall biosynthesis
MKWYTKYLSVFEKPFEEAPQETINGIREKLKNIQSADPIASVVVIAHNEEQRLLGCLWSLSENKTSYPIEIIGVENNSSDKTADVFKAVGIPWFYEEQKSCGFARNRGRIHAKGKYYICIDSDTMYPPLYIQTLVDKLEKPGIVAVSSLWSFLPDKKFPSWKLKIFEMLRDLSLWLQAFKRPELSVRGMVFAYNLEYGRKIEYRGDIIRGEDGMMALGLKKYGKLAFVRSAASRAVTSNSTLKAQGNMFKVLKVRLSKMISRFGGYFTKKQYYKDQDSNLIK